MTQQRCRYEDCPNADKELRPLWNDVCPHDDGCECTITCPLCRAYMGLSPIGTWSVVVGNIGTVCADVDEQTARQTFAEYVSQSAADYGRAAGESVTLLYADDILEEYNP